MSEHRQLKITLWLVLYLTAFVSFGIAVWKANPRHVTEAVAIYTGCATGVTALGPGFCKAFMAFLDEIV